METTTIAEVSQAGAIYKAVGGHLNLPSMNQPGANAYIGDSLSNPGGSRLCAGYFELKAGEPLVYEYTYDESKVAIAGEFIVTDVASGEVTRAKERDILFFPQGTLVKLETADYALDFFTGDRTFAT